MAIAPMYFQPLSPQQANPMLYGMGQGTTIADQGQANIGQSLMNAMKAQQVPYAGQQAQAQLGLTQAQVPYLNSQTALNIGTLPYLGMKYSAQMLLAQARSMQAVIQNQNSYATLMKLPGAQKLLQQRPDLAQTLVQAMNNSSSMINNGTGFPGGGLSSVAPNGTLTNSSAASLPPQIPANGNDINPAVFSVLPGGTTNPQQQNQPGMTIAPQEVNQLRALVQPDIPQPLTDAQAVQQGTLNAYLDKNLSPQQSSAMVYENVVDGLLKQNQPQITNAAQFSGLAGHAGQRAGQYAQALGLNSSQQYRDFQAFTTQTAPLLANELRRAFQGQATDKETSMMNDIANPTAWDKDPQQVMQEFNTMMTNLKANGQEITKTPTEAMSTLKQNLANPISFKASGIKKLDSTTLTPDALASTAKKYNMSVAQVQQLLQQHGAI
jgi:hypothetical protein